jgi:hypothetical protein
VAPENTRKILRSPLRVAASAVTSLDNEGNWLAPNAAGGGIIAV